MKPESIIRRPIFLTEKSNSLRSASNQVIFEVLRDANKVQIRNAVQLDGAKLRVGRRLEFDAATERFKTDAEANALLTRQYRAPFVVPNSVA